MDDLDVICPRCRGSVRQRFYGPCPSCRDELRATLSGSPAVDAPADVPRYEPKMNVVPNHVATKD